MAYQGTTRIAILLLAVLACSVVEAGRASAQAVGSVDTQRAPATNAPAAERVAVTGVVVDQDGRPLPNATIEARNATDEAQARLTTTANDGSYTLDLEPGTYRITVTPPAGSGLAAVLLPDQTVAGDAVLNMALTAAAPVQVQGRLLDGRGGPLANATIHLASADGTTPSRTTRTDADGRFFIEATSGEHHFHVRGEGRPGSVASPRFEAESSVFLVDDDVDLLIALPFQAVTVRIQDREGRALAGVSITAVLTDAAASFITAGLTWKGWSAYNDAASARVTDEPGTAALFLFPTAYDLTARPREGWGLKPETVPGVAVGGASTQVIVFDPPATLNTPPLADAGTDQTAHVGQTIQLDGSGASDPDGDAISYRWRLALPQPVTGTAVLFDPLPQPVTGTAVLFDPLPKPVTGTAEIIDAYTASPSFVAHAPGVYALDLVVNDGTADSPPDRIRIRVTNPSPEAVILTPPDEPQQTFFVRLGQTERSAHSWLQDQRWPRYVGIGAMAVGQVVYVRAQYANDEGLIHPSQALFDFGFNLSSYVMINRFTDFAGVSLLQNWMLQAVINTTLDHPIVWPDEPSHYDLLGVDVPKVFHGERRWIQLGIGTGLIVVPRIVRKLRSRR